VTRPAPSTGIGRLEQALAAIDAANAGDPNRIIVRGNRVPKELGHAALMSEWVRRLDPDADEAQLLAARAHHLRRWVVPRSSHPDGRAGYLRWRAEQKRRHADEVGVILRDAGYDDTVIGRVQRIIRKEGQETDPAVQVHEDALCLVFLETQLADTVDRLGDDKMVDIIRKTAAKMSDDGLAAVTQLPLRDHDRELIQKALAQ
jgi:hypothetical protein